MTALRHIGWREKIDLPELGLHGIRAKVDTGARTSVLHCPEIKLLQRDGQPYVSFRPLDADFAGGHRTCVLPLHAQRTIKNSFGQLEHRYVIRTQARMFGELFDIEISLRDRSAMRFPMLLGRSFVRGKFIVDVGRFNLASNA